MTCFLGIDVGTSSVKSILMDMEGTILGIAQRKYDVQKPRADWAEQDADVLWCATKETLRELVQKYPRQAADLAGIGYSRADAWPYFLQMKAVGQCALRLSGKISVL